MGAAPDYGKTDSTTPPRALVVQPDGIPPELTARRQWVGWTWGWSAQRGEWAKIPKHPRTGGNARSTDAATWTDFATAYAAMRRRGWAGVGFVVTRDDPFTGVDLDHCLDPQTGALAPWAAAIVAALDSYTEVTPSGTGLRVWVRGSLIGRMGTKGDGTPKEGARTTTPPKIEIYCGSRYFTVTGRRWQGGGDD